MWLSGRIFRRVLFRFFCVVVNGQVELIKLRNSEKKKKKKKLHFLENRIKKKKILHRTCLAVMTRVGKKIKRWGKKLVHVVEETRAHLLSVQRAKNMQKK